MNNAWLTLWVKVGFIGVALFSLLLLFHIRSIFSTLWLLDIKDINVYARVLILGYAFSFPSIIFASIATANLVFWITTISIISIFMGIIEKIRVDIDIKTEIKSYNFRIE